MPDLLRDPLAVEHAPVDHGDVAIAKLGMIVADIDDDDAARYVGKQPPRKVGDGLRRDRKDDDVRGLGGVDNGSGRCAELGRQGGQALRSLRVRNRDAMAEPDEVPREDPSHAACADDSDSHVDPRFEIVTGPRHGGVSMPLLSYVHCVIASEPGQTGADRARQSGLGGSAG